ncbi:nucleotidyl transferase AbiEii/AbiGii toxin family protein [Polaromonas sp.]|uniref:nucleotidyl transferase AbiEii/AbiGii toxin family protein n=1 Tax=Polaromonas sp. TaxID=1869339 RepID=UPI0013B80B01|nr:nucleotidyl transferase AbiEii/AbiGii toxin family protein [Polaromonas sp.]NDP62502.1 nucleotidyl transferase AbiEii/AbiGii toxin family protein [Polaromonas sp.]
MATDTQSRRVLALAGVGHCADGAHAANRDQCVGACERGVYRLGQSAHADHFVFKGAMLFNLWCAMPHHPTRDVDLLGFGASDLESIAQTFREIVSVAASDGMEFDAASVVVDEIRKNAGCAGARVLVSA